MNLLCPKGHTSSDADYCSECGSKMAASVSDAVPRSASVSVSARKPEQLEVIAPVEADSANSACPDCGTERANGAHFCEVCRYDFQRKASSVDSLLPTEVSVAAPANEVAAADLADSAFVENASLSAIASAQRLAIAVITDATLVQEPDPGNPCPVDAPERVFPLDLAENLVGRRSASKECHPEIPINDPGISRRHLKFLRRADGQFEVVELGSANGSAFNSAPLEPGVQTLIAPGDQLVVGMWTRLIVRAR